MQADRLLRSYSYSLLYQALNVLAPFLTIPYVSRTIGPNGLGQYAFLNAIAAYFVFVAGFAISIYGNREVAKVRHDKKILDDVIWKLVGLQIVMACLSTILFSVFYSIGIFGVGSEILVIILGVQVFFAFLDVSWYFMGIESMRILAVRNAGIKLGSLILVFALVKGPFDLWKYAGIIVLSAVIGNLYAFRALLRVHHFRWVGYRDILLMVKMALPIFIPQFLMILYGNADRVLIGYLGGSMSVASYDQTMKIITILLSSVVSLRPIMISRLSRIDSSVDVVERQLANAWVLEVVGFLAFFLFGGIAGGGNGFATWFFGHGFEQVKVLLPILSIVIVVCSYGDVLVNQIMVAAGKERELGMVLGVMTVVTFSLYALLIPRFGAIGAAIALVLANSVILFYEWYLLRDLIDTIRFLRGFGRNAFASMFMVIAGLILGGVLPRTFFGTLVSAIGMSLVYIIMQIALKNEVMLRGADIFRSTLQKLMKTA